jgi:hypothetical protein
VAAVAAAVAVAAEGVSSEGATTAAAVVAAPSRASCGAAAASVGRALEESIARCFCGSAGEEAMLLLLKLFRDRR